MPSVDLVVAVKDRLEEYKEMVRLGPIFGGFAPFVDVWRGNS